MSSTVSGFKVYALVDGTSFNTRLAWNSSVPLRQYVDNDGNVTPNWTGETFPTIWIEVRDGEQVLVPTDVQWYINQVLLTGANYVTSGTQTVDGVAVPTLQIKTNIASSDNRNEDLLTCKCKVTVAGQTIDVESSTVIEIQTKASSSFDALIVGRSYVDSTDTSTTLTAKLNDTAGTEVTDNGKTYAWSYVNADGETVTAITESVTIDNDDIMACTKVSLTITYKGNIYKATMDVMDFSDAYSAYFKNDNETVGKGGSVTITPVIVNSKTQSEIVPKGAVYTLKNSTGIAIPVPGTAGITQTGIDLAITYAAIVVAGYSINGWAALTF